MSILGAHVSIGKGIVVAGQIIKEVGGDIVQIFLTSPRRQLVSDRSKEELEAINKELNKISIKLVVHSSYLLNIAREWDQYSWWIRNFIMELKYCWYAGAIGLVVHIGKQKDLTKSEGYNNMYIALAYVVTQTINTPTTILIETSSGQGSEMCYQLEDLAYFYNKLVKNPTLSSRIGICVDTCHVHAAGHDMSQPKNIDKYLHNFDKLIGLKHIKLIHLNDSVKECGSRVDRHQNIGEGTIGKKGLFHMYKWAKKNKVPTILETPSLGYINEVPLLKKL